MSDSFVMPRGEVTLHVRIQLLGVLLLFRCVCQGATLIAQRYSVESNFSFVTQYSLLTCLFVLFEDGQGLITFLLLGLQPAAPKPPGISSIPSSPSLSTLARELEQQCADDLSPRVRNQGVPNSSFHNSPATRRFLQKRRLRHRFAHHMSADDSSANYDADGPTQPPRCAWRPASHLPWDVRGSSTSPPGARPCFNVHVLGVLSPGTTAPRSRPHEQKLAAAFSAPAPAMSESCCAASAAAPAASGPRKNRGANSAELL